MNQTLTLFSLCLLMAAAASAEDAYKSIHTAKGYDGVSTYGLVSPLDQAGKHFYVQNADGLIEVKLTENAQVGLLFRENKISQLLANRKVTFRGIKERFYALPKDLYVRVQFKNWREAQRALESGKFKYGMLSAKALPDHLPTESELWLSGRLSGLEKGHITPIKVVKIGEKTFTGSTSGHNHAEQLTGLLDHTAIRPFINQASLYGRMQGTIFHAEHVLLRPIPDQTASDDPNLRRYLFIGDSISGNYGSGLREALKGKFNVHHPPTNCGPSGKGNNSMQQWLGDYKKKGRHWDVISFNFGHWDAGQTKARYQANLEGAIRQMKDTGAKLIWVTTCPVPDGYAKAGDLNDKGEAPGRTAGVMKKYLNPWALAVIKRHPEITICDQWQYVEDNRQGIYQAWWQGKNVHFKGEPAAKLGEYLAEHVMRVMK